MDLPATGRARAPTDESFDAWYAGSFDRVVRAVAVALGDADLAGDATSEAYARALERWPDVRAMTNRDGWVYRVAVNGARGTIRRRVLERAWRDRQRPRPEPEPEVSDAALWDAVGRLSVRQREAVALRYVGGLAESEVADAMGISEGAASSTLTAARRRLAEMLGGGEP